MELSLILSIPLSLVTGWALALVAVHFGYRMGRGTQGLATGQIWASPDTPERTKAGSGDSGYPDPWEEMQAEPPVKGIETVQR